MFQTVADALGRLVQVTEAPNDANFNYLTSYDYDVLDNLTTGTQGSQTRTSVYDSLKRFTYSIQKTARLTFNTITMATYS